MKPTSSLATLSAMFSILLVASFFGCQPAPAPGLSGADQQAIRETIKAALSIANTSADWNAYTTLYYTEDAIVSRPNAAALKGKDAIMASLKGHPAFSDFKSVCMYCRATGNRQGDACLLLAGSLSSRCKMVKQSARY